MVNRELVREYIEDNCIARAPLGEKILLKKGAVFGSDKIADYNTWIFMMRAALYEPKIMKEVNKYFFDIFENKLKNGYAIIGIEHSSTPLIASFIYEGERRGLEIQALSIRKEQKEYGLKGWYEGTVPAANKFILIDDVSSDNRNALKHMLDNLPTKPVAIDMFCLVNLGVTEKYKDIEIYAMFNKNDFILKYEDYVDKISAKFNVSDNSGIQSVPLESVSFEYNSSV